MDYQKFSDSLPDEGKEPWVSEAKLAGAAIKENLPKEPGIVLFIGGGTGKFACAVGALGHKVMMMEISKRAVDVAAERIRQNGLGLKVVPIWEEFGKLKFDDGTFDLVVAERGALSLYEKFDKCVSEMKRVTKKGGKIIATFFLASPFRKVKLRKFEEVAVSGAFNGAPYSKTANGKAACLVFSR